MSNIILFAYPFLFALAISVALVFLILRMLEKNRMPVDFEKNDFLKKTLPRSGGAAIVLSFLFVIAANGSLVFDSVKVGMLLSAVIILLFGLCDDFAGLSWKKQLLFQIAIALIMIYVGLRVDYIANPFGGGEFRLDQLMINGWPFWGSVFVFLWIIGFMNTMNWIDGIDGLAGGIGFIGAVTLFLISVSDLVNQPPLGIVAATFAGSVLGFLLFNVYPARVIMGTSGSMFLGFMLAVLAIFSGGKIATLLLVMGLPIFDAVYVITQRIRAGESPFKGDMRHLHHRLLDFGWSQRKIAFFMYAISAFFGGLALAFQSMGKVVALIAMLIFAILFIFVMEYKKKVVE